MDCIAKDTEDEQQQALVPNIRKEIVRDLVSGVKNLISNHC